MISELQFEAIVDVFGACIMKRHLLLKLNIIYDKFRFDGDFFVRNLDPSVEIRARAVRGCRENSPKGLHLQDYDTFLIY